jgi:hypothetical protein
MAEVALAAATSKSSPLYRRKDWSRQASFTLRYDSLPFLPPVCCDRRDKAKQACASVILALAPRVAVKTCALHVAKGVPCLTSRGRIDEI